MWDNDSASWLWEKDPCFRNEVPKKTSSLLLLGAQEKRLSAEQDELPCGPKGTSTGNCQETETRMPRACYAPRQSLQKHRSAEQMLDGRRHRVDIPVHARTTSNDLQQKRLGDDLCWIVPHPPPPPAPLPDDAVGQGTELTWTFCLTINFFTLLSEGRLSVTGNNGHTDSSKPSARLWLGLTVTWHSMHIAESIVGDSLWRYQASFINRWRQTPFNHRIHNFSDPWLCTETCTEHWCGRVLQFYRWYSRENTLRRSKLICITPLN